MSMTPSMRSSQFGDGIFNSKHAECTVVVATVLFVQIWNFLFLISIILLGINPNRPRQKHKYDSEIAKNTTKKGNYGYSETKGVLQCPRWHTFTRRFYNYIFYGGRTRGAVVVCNLIIYCSLLSMPICGFKSRSQRCLRKF